jgi:hypothetical protein
VRESPTAEKRKIAIVVAKSREPLSQEGLFAERRRTQLKDFYSRKNTGPSVNAAEGNI